MSFLLLLLALSSHWNFAPQAQAASFSYEFQLGVSEFRGADPFFGTGLPSPLAYGLGFNLGTTYNLPVATSATEIQFGLLGRLDSSADPSGLSYSLLSIYPIIRIQLAQAFVGVGATNILWQRAAAAYGIDAFEFHRQAIAYLAEAGVLWAVTPLFSLGAEASMQFINENGNMSPNPIASAEVVFRFYFGFSSGGSGGGGGGGSSNEFKGWRYPFGNRI